MALHRDSNGQLPAFAWPGGYPLFYLTADNAVLCPDCANGKNGSDASEADEDTQWRLVACNILWEGEPEICEHCNAEIKSAYGIPE